MATKLYVQAATACGRKSRNQDCVLYGTELLQENPSVDLEAWGRLIGEAVFTAGERRLILAVMDGISGGNAGEWASWETGRLLRRYALDWEGAATIERINRIVRESHRQKEPNAERGSGSTLSCICVKDDRMEALNVGDSPIYLFRDGGSHALYREHTGAAWKERNGYGGEDITERDRHVLTDYIGCRHDIEQAVYREELALQDGDVVLIASDGVFEGIGLERVREIAFDIRYRNAADQIVREALRQSTDNVTALLLYVKNTQEWNQDPKIRALQSMGVPQIARALEVSRDTAEKIRRGAYMPDTREKVLKLGLLAGFGGNEMNYWLEKIGFPVLYSKNVGDFMVRFIIQSGYSGGKALTLYRRLGEAIGQMRFQERHGKYRRMDTFGMDDAVQDLAQDGRNGETMEAAIRRFEERVSRDPSYLNSFESRYEYAKSYLDHLINRVYCQEGLIPHLMALGLDEKSAKGISNRRSAMYRMRIDENTGETVINYPSREYFMALALLLKLDPDELDYLLDTNGLVRLESEREPDGLLLRALKPLEKCYPAAFFTDIPAARDEEPDWGWDAVRRAGLEFAFREGGEKPEFLYPKELCSYLLAYIQAKEPGQMVAFRRSDLYEKFVHLLDPDDPKKEKKVRGEKDV